MRGSVYHNKWVCKVCREGDKNTILHRHHYIQVYLPYLGTKAFKLSGKEKGKPFKDGVEAYIYLREIQEQIEDKSFIPWNYRKQSNSICQFGTFFQKFKADKYYNLARYLKPLWDYDLSDIDRIVIKKFYRNLPDNLKTSTKNLILQVARAVLSEAFQEGLIDVIPAFPRRDKKEKSAKNWLTREEQMAAIKEMPDRFKLIFLFLAYHGKRISESLSLKWENVDWKKKACKLYQSKILTEQWLPFHEDFFKELPIAGAINKTGNVFQQYSGDHLNHTLKEACAKAGIKAVTTHEFSRHSFVSQRQEIGLTNEQIALATDNLSSIKEYSHMDIERKRKVINAL